jgi:hypothetical protein
MAFPDQAKRALIMAQEGFTQLEALGILEKDMNMMEMAKKMASCTQAEGQVLLGTVAIKQLCITWNCRSYQATLYYLELSLFNGNYDEAGDSI